MKNFLSIKEKILHLRDSGKVYCDIIARNNQDIKKSLIEFCEKIGFSTNENLREIDKVIAIKIMRLILMKNLVYDSQIMTNEQANNLANDFCFLFEDNTKFFTNGNFEEKISGEFFLKSWKPMTKYMCDTGVFSINKKLVGCLWVEDED